MNQHSKPPTIYALDAIYKLNPSTGHYELYEPEEHYSMPVTWLVWAAFWTAGVSLAYLLYLAAQAWLG